jgi:predicted nucleic acid-binding protein
MNAIDTNIWIYCHDSRDAEKQRISQELIEAIEPISLLWQVGCEFITAARKLRPFGFSEEEAWQSLEDMQIMASRVLLPVPDLWSRSRTIQQQHGLHFWDAIIIATCLHYQVSTLYSEDIPESNDFHGLKIINPFHS